MVAQNTRSAIYDSTRSKLRENDILEGYLNTIYYGHGVYGIEAAANFYFGKSARELTVAEAAMLAGIPKGPSYYSPLVDMERAKKRQRIVLQAMVETNVLSKEEAKQAANEPLHFSNGEQMKTKQLPHIFKMQSNIC